MAPENKTGTKLLGLVDELDDAGEAGVTELANRLDIAKSTAHYHLETLCEQGFVVKDDGTYRLSLRFLEVGDRRRRNIPLYEAAKEQVDDIAAETGELAILMVPEQGLGVYLHKAAGSDAIDIDAPIGRFATLHNRALGKAILAYMDRSTVEEIIVRHGLPATTDETITSPESLFDSLEQIREAGIAYNTEESIEGLHGVAVPILDDDGSVLGAISIAGPSKRLEGGKFRETYPTLLSRVRNVVELNVQHPEPQ